MKEKWLQTDRAGKIRLIVLLIICAWCAYCVIAYSYEIYHLNISQAMVDTKNMNDIYIDGANFTGVFKLLGTGANGLTLFAVLGAYCIAMIVMTIIPLFLYWLIAVSRADIVSAEEAELAKNTCGIGGFAGLIGGILVTGFSSRMPAVLFTLIWLLPSFFIVVIPLRKKISG